MLSDHSTRREQLRQDRGGLQEKVQAAHTAWRTEQESLLNRELAVNDLRHRQDTLVGRLRDGTGVAANSAQLAGAVRPLAQAAWLEARKAGAV